MTDFRAKGTIMGLTGLTAVFGMGTGGTPPVWSPESRPRGWSNPLGRAVAVFGHARERLSLRWQEAPAKSLHEGWTPRFV